MSSFELAFNNIADKTVKEMDNIVRGGVFQLFSDIVYGTPVDSGRARGNWQISVDIPKDNKLDILDKSGNATVERANFALGGSIGNYIFITNNLPYIRRLEFGLYPNPPKSGIKTLGGFSKQAPQGFVRINILRLNSIFKQQIKG